MLPLFNGSAAALTHHKMYFNQNKPVGLIWGAEGSLTVKWILTSMHCTHWNSAPLVSNHRDVFQPEEQESGDVTTSCLRVQVCGCSALFLCTLCIKTHVWQYLMSDQPHRWPQRSVHYSRIHSQAERRQRFLLVIQQQVGSLKLLLWPCRSLHLQHLHIYQPVFLACTGSQQVTSYLSTRMASTNNTDTSEKHNCSVRLTSCGSSGPCSCVFSNCPAALVTDEGDMSCVQVTVMYRVLTSQTRLTQD